MNVGGNQESSWWLKYGAKGVGCAGGLIAMGLGLFGAISVSPICIVAGIFQMLAGFIVVSAEAPFCCMFVDFVDRYSKWVELRPYWQKAALYICVALPPVFMCVSLSIIFGSGLIFLTGVLYGMMALGKKADRSEMMAAAASTNASNNGSTNIESSNMKSTLVDMEVLPATK